ncbi:hypothetical protein M3J09_013841 [Ascochyta lentis]
MLLLHARLLHDDGRLSRSFVVHLHRPQLALQVRLLGVVLLLFLRERVLEFSNGRVSRN